LKESDCENAVVIMDEFDDMIVTNPVLVNLGSDSKIKYGGMMAANKAKQLILLSATVENFDTIFCKKLLKVSQDRVIYFKGATELFS
jgi:hypothetical protein